jgi:hypothetical protein
MPPKSNFSTAYFRFFSTHTHTPLPQHLLYPYPTSSMSKEVFSHVNPARIRSFVFCFGIVQIAHTPFFFLSYYSSTFRRPHTPRSLMYITALCAGGGDKRGRDLRWALIFCGRWTVGGGRQMGVSLRRGRCEMREGGSWWFCARIDAIEYKHVVADSDGRCFNLVWVLCP